MRTTLDIDDDVLQVAKELASARGSTAGKVLSELARKALEPAGSARLVNGVPVLPRRARDAERPTMQRVGELREPE
jgi:hypothetical protein